MDDYVVCLGCGGVVAEPGQRIDADQLQCACIVEVRPKMLVCPGCGGSLREGTRACPYCRATLATSRCSNCSAWNLAEAQYCQKCGEAIDHVASVHEAPKSVGACPRCTAALVARSYAHLDVFECDACGGIFLEGEMLDSLLRDHDNGDAWHLALPVRVRVKQSETRYLPCPSCQKLMNRTMFGRVSGVIVDTCKGHGIWFDSGELSEVLAFVDRGGLVRSRERQLDEIKEAERSLRAAQIAAVHSASKTPEPEGYDFVKLLMELWRAL